MAEYQEKVKIYITSEVDSILKKDIELFEFTKKDGTLNPNHFLNTLIANYQEDYETSKTLTYVGVLDILAKYTTNLTNFEVEDLSSRITRFVEEKGDSTKKAKADVTLSFKPTRVSQARYSYIKEHLLGNDTESNYFRQMLISYTSLPQNARERVIFKDIVERIESAIEKHTKITIEFTNGRFQTVSPYALSSSKEELFNYLLCEDKHGKASTRRLCRIKNATPEAAPCTFHDDTLAELEYAKINSPQYLSQPQTIKVQLTKQGKRLLHKIYLHRPKLVRIEGDYYYFEAPEAQAMQYFFKLGKDAIIIEPESLAISIQKDHYDAQRAYYREHKAAIDAIRNSKKKQ